ncbi:MAG: sensor histidine kinase [Lewinella sp.]|nr:sensor histidine kinase [Lewinella sp.]
MVYMLMAFAWWSILLYTKNRDAYRAKVELLQLGMVAEGLVKTPEDFLGSERFQTLNRQYRRQEYMILGETVFLILSLLGGMYIIYRGYQQEMRASRQQHNFLLSITHELKSPLASIRLNLETLLKRQQLLQPQQIELLSDHAIKEADRLNKLVEDLLLSARLESAYQFHLEPVDLALLAEKQVERVQAQFPQAELSFQADEELPLVAADQQALTSVILNLLENAVKYSPAPAQVRLQLVKQADQGLQLIVTDQGFGIPKGEKQRIFDKFYRVGSEDTRSTKGTGLGLFIVREIIRAHHGRIEVRDNQPQGTVFTITLPGLTPV